jgi:hypothetical protein
MLLDVGQFLAVGSKGPAAAECLKIKKERILKFYLDEYLKKKKTQVGEIESKTLE